MGPAVSDIKHTTVKSVVIVIYSNISHETSYLSNTALTKDEVQDGIT